jgi:hypothetical protein
VLLAVLADIAAEVPAGEVPSSLRLVDGSYELETVDATEAHGLRGSIFKLVKRGSRWHVADRGRWVS